jgi:hypothetical protein
LQTTRFRKDLTRGLFFFSLQRSRLGLLTFFVEKINDR